MKSILGSLTLGLFLSLAYGVLGLYLANRDKAIAPNEGMATANVHRHYGSRTTAISNAQCHYTFDVGGNIYSGGGICPDDSSTKMLVNGLVGVGSFSTATVYYDPNNPNINSFVEFGARVPNDYMKAKVGFGLAAGCVLLLGIGVVIAAKASQPGGGMMVDAKGTLIYPDQINSDDERFSAHPTHISKEEID